MEPFMFVKINEVITDSRWYKPGEIYMVKRHFIEDDSRHRLLHNPFNDRAFEHKRDAIRHRYQDDALAISVKECTRIDPPRDFRNKDCIGIIDLAGDG